MPDGENLSAARVDFLARQSEPAPGPTLDSNVAPQDTGRLAASPTEIIVDTEQEQQRRPQPSPTPSERLRSHEWPGAAPPPLPRRRDWLLRPLPPWLVSGVLHALTVIVLGLWVLGVEPDAVIRLESGTRLEDLPLDPLDLDQSSLDMETSIAAVDAPDLFEVDDPFASPVVDLAPTLDPVKPVVAPAVPVLGSALSGREPGRKEALIAAGGGTPGTVNAVKLGLEWLARMQRPGGYWSMTEPYRDGAISENRIAATALAMLAFLGDGHTHQGGTERFRRAVAKGLLYLRGQQNKDGSFYKLTTSKTHRLYTDALCTIVFCELYAMTGDESLREPAQRAIDFGVSAQSPQLGGWKYEPTLNSDLSVTGWWVMALQSGLMGGLFVPEEVLYRVDEFLDRCAFNDGQQYYYEPHEYNRRSSLAMTAEGLLCRQYRGWGKHDPRMQGGVDFIARNPMLWSNRNCYYWYYATQVLHNMGGEQWVAWNKTLRELLPAQQEIKGPARGSWHPGTDLWARSVGRLYVTCLHIYMLEVYYRHLPLYGGERVRDSAGGP